MPAFIVAVWEFVAAGFSRIMATRLGSWLVQACVFLGISFVSSKFTSSYVTPQLASYFSAAGADIFAWIKYLNIDKAITIVLSAYATASASHWAITRATPSK